MALAHGLLRALYRTNGAEHAGELCISMRWEPGKLDLMHIEDEVFAAADSDKSQEMTVDEIQKLLIQQVRYLINCNVAASSQLAA